MKIHNLRIFALFILTLSNYSCEKVIDLKLDETEPVIVIEGNITNSEDVQSIYVSRSRTIGQDNEFSGISGATVTVTDNLGLTSTFREQSPGLYTSRRLRGLPGNTYTLKVTADGKEYIAKSTMPAPVVLDSINITSTTIFGNENKSLQVIFNDPQDLKNYYRFVLYINGAKSKSIFVINDDFNNGNKVVEEIFDIDQDIKSGDVTVIEMQSIDESIYKYWMGLDQNRNRGGASTTPANPISNISNGALGYFSAHTIQAGAVKVP